MASEEQKPGANWTSGVAALAVALAVGPYFFQHEAPLVGSRPGIEEIDIREAGHTHRVGVPARLWQDPFAAVYKSIDNAAKEDFKDQCRKTPAKNGDDSVCSTPLRFTNTSNPQETSVVLGVTMSAAPYAEDSEQRRRTRFAVLAGLEQQGFTPEDAQHILYFIWELKGKTMIIPYERLRNTAKNKDAVLVWLRDDYFAEQPLKKLGDFAAFLRDHQNGKRITIIGPNSSDMLSKMLDEMISCVVNDDQVDCELRADRSVTDNLKDVRFLIASATASDSLLLPIRGASVNRGFDACPQITEEAAPSTPHGIKATAQHRHNKFPKTALTEERDNNCRIKDILFSNHAHIFVDRPFEPDDVLAEKVVQELEKRYQVFSEGAYDVALISEWDTTYGRALTQTMKQEFQKLSACKSGEANKSQCPGIHSLTYLRGLDGQLPVHEGTGEDKADKASTQDSKENSAVAFFRTQTDPDNLDRPVGQGQFDYLRRMSEELRQIDQGLRRQNPPRRISAIGVLGSDVFDKLLILRALRPTFPEAQFFTTVFDEAFSMQSELSWTRNLIIAANFGPKLSAQLQGDIPPFRDSRQTSAFLTTQLAVADTLGEDNLGEALRQEAKHPQIFEIERSGHPLPLTTVTRSDPGSATPACAREAACDDLDQVILGKAKPLLDFLSQKSDALPEGITKGANFLQGKLGFLNTVDGQRNLANDPGNEDEGLFPKYESNSRYSFISGLALLGSVMLIFYICGIWKSMKLELLLLSMALYLGAGISLFWGRFASWLTSYGGGEPIAFIEGVSVWPTVALRILGAILASYLAFREVPSREFGDYCRKYESDEICFRRDEIAPLLG